MHTLLFLSSMTAAMLAGSMLVRLANRADGWRPRRTLQFLALTVPVLGLSFNLLGLHHFAVASCFLGMPSWDYLLGAALPLTTALLTLVAIVAAFARLVMLHRLVVGQGFPAGPMLLAQVDRLAARLGAPIP
ncbi:MAG: hypothetical protein NTZ05_03430, partial [Chloroflexi bacterium]|nr:hypothetical protein [Chloroflexota bacterium]